MATGYSRGLDCAGRVHSYIFKRVYIKECWGVSMGVKMKEYGLMLKKVGAYGCPEYLNQTPLMVSAAPLLALSPSLFRRPNTCLVQIRFGRKHSSGDCRSSIK